MRTGLDHLPPAKQRELNHVVRILFEEFEAAHALGTQKWKKQGRILKLVLYGSYARGDWVDDPIGGYQSDYDILIVVNDERLTEFEFWSAAEDRLMRETTIARTLSAPVNFIVHTLTDVNQQLERGRPFFVDIVEQGIALYEAEGFAFAQPRKLPPEEATAEAQKHFDRWFPSASEFCQPCADCGPRGYGEQGRVPPSSGNRATLSLHAAGADALQPQVAQAQFPAIALRSDRAEPDRGWPRGDKFSRRCFDCCARPTSMPATRRNMRSAPRS